MSGSGSGIDYLLRDIRLFGRDAGEDYIDTHKESFVREMISQAECRKTSLTIPTPNFGKSAKEGMASKLGALSGMKVETNKIDIVISWVDIIHKTL